MPVTKAQQRATNRYISRAYDKLNIIIPRGRREAVAAHSKARGKSVNGLVNYLIREDMGLTEEQWKARPSDE